MNFTKSFLTIFILFLASLRIANACSCLYVDLPFCISCNLDNNIIQAVVTDKPYWYSMEVEVIENINLQVDSSTILILGQDGLNCGQDLDIFEVGDTLILALYNFPQEDAVNNEVYNWTIDGCNINYLFFSKSNVDGTIDYDTTSKSYEDFKLDLMDCLELSVSNNDIIEEDILIYPNPMDEYVIIESDNANSVKVYALSGQLIITKTSITTDTILIDMSSVDSGVYFVRVETQDGFFIKKIIKN